MLGPPMDATSKSAAITESGDAWNNAEASRESGPTQDSAAANASESTNIVSKSESESRDSAIVLDATGRDREELTGNSSLKLKDQSRQNERSHIGIQPERVDSSDASARALSERQAVDSDSAISSDMVDSSRTLDDGPHDGNSVSPLESTDSQFRGSPAPRDSMVSSRRRHPALAEGMDREDSTPKSHEPKPQEPRRFTPPIQVKTGEQQPAEAASRSDSVENDPITTEPVATPKVDGDIDAESVERLRSALKAFPGRQKQRMEAESSDRGASNSDVQALPGAALVPEQIAITPQVEAMKPSIASVLRYHYARPENMARRSPWGTFHLMLPFGTDAQVLSGNRRYNTVSWLCGNFPCHGQRLMTTTRSGRIFARQGVGLQGHQGQFLAMLAQVNVGTEQALKVGRQEFTVEDLIRAEMADCREGNELTFALIGLSHYIPTDTYWTASDGKQWNFDTLIKNELAQPIVGAACGGTHRLMSFSYALRQRKLEGLPIEGQWQRAETFIGDFVDYAWTLQNPDGSFSTDWFEGRADNRDIDRKIQTSGHILEWLIFTTDKSQLQDERFVRGINFLTNAFSRYRSRDWKPGPKGHVLRALSLYYRRVYGDDRPWMQSSQVANNRAYTNQRSRYGRRR